MDLNKLLNPVNKHNMYDDRTEEEIHQAVIEQCEAEQDREKNVSDGAEDDLHEAVEVKPYRQEALAAALTLSKYVANLNKPFAHKLEVILMSFGHQTHLDAINSLQPTTLTNFYTFQGT
jgi:hypothetical protein